MTIPPFATVKSAGQSLVFICGIFLLPCVMLSACFPYTSVPMVALTGYDLSQKRDRWRQYAATGDVYAMYALAESYNNRPMEGGLDRAEAFKWYCAAARSGYGKSQIQVGEIYQGLIQLNDIEVKTDFAKARMWYGMAKRRAMNEAFEHLAVLEPQMEQAEIKASEKMMANFKKVPCGTEDKNVKVLSVETPADPELSNPEKTF